MTNSPNTAPNSGGMPQPLSPEELAQRQQTRAYFVESGTILSLTMPDMHNRWRIPGTDKCIPAAVASRISKEVAGRIAIVSN